MEFFFPINVILIIRLGSPKTCEDLLLHLVVFQNASRYSTLWCAVPEEVQPLSPFLFNWNSIGISTISTILSLKTWVLRVSNVLSPLVCFRTDITRSLSLQKRKIEMKISVKRRVLYTHTHIVQEVQNKLKIAGKNQDAQYSASFFSTYTRPEETLIWMVSEAIAEGSFFHAAFGPETLLIPTVLKSSVKMNAVQLPSHNPFPTSMPQKQFLKLARVL